ncbi:hypothetical protein SAMN05444748_102602 [Variovorax sp. OV700]|nr:hypothetical protein SAMN05444748_102602 [Variovorax sp. OV700]
MSPRNLRSAVAVVERVELLRDRYAVVVRIEHPMAKGPKAADVRMTIQDLRRLEYVAERSHPNPRFRTKALVQHGCTTF